MRCQSTVFKKFCIEIKRKRHETKMVFSLTDSEETYKRYPYHFEIKVKYELFENEFKVSYCVSNKEKKVMYFGVGGHPGFQVPIEQDLSFERLLH